MINKITYKEEPHLFDDLTEFSIESIQDHRRGSNFFREEIIEFTEEDKQWFEEVKDFDKYLGTWKTNQVIWDDNYEFDETFSELTRVRKKEIISHEWEEVI